jgi:SAM-dependent methyltransferase
MRSIYRLSKRLYRMLASEDLNRVLFNGRTPFSKRIVGVKTWLEGRASHDDIYDAEFFRRHEPWMKNSALGIAASIHERLAPKTVIDVGCGSGEILERLRDLEIDGLGLEYATAGLEMCRSKRLRVMKFDLEQDVTIPERADVVLSTEVAEHLPASVADRYVDLLCSLSDMVLVTAAVPGQGGTDHVNEQPNEYWIEKFARRGFSHDARRTSEWRSDWTRRSVDHHRADNLLVFQRSSD